MHGMNPAEFANIARCERDFWWYRGVRAILYRILHPYLEAAPSPAFWKRDAAPAIFPICSRPGGVGPWFPWT